VLLTEVAGKLNTLPAFGQSTVASLSVSWQTVGSPPQCSVALNFLKQIGQYMLFPNTIMLTKGPPKIGNQVAGRGKLSHPVLTPSILLSRAATLTFVVHYLDS